MGQGCKGGHEGSKSFTEERGKTVSWSVGREYGPPIHGASKKRIICDETLDRPG